MGIPTYSIAYGSNSLDNIYYVYQYIREDGTPYYIGKGKHNRAWEKHKNIPLPIDKERILIIANNLTESQAFNLEKDLILKHGRKNNNTGILHNKTDGGEGVSGNVVSDKTKKILSEINKGKTILPETREKLRIYNTGKKLSADHIEKIKQKNTGKIKTSETREKMSIAKKGLSKAEQHKLKISQSLKGKPWSVARRNAQLNKIK